MSGKITVKAQESGERIDALLSRCVEGLTRSAAQRLIEQGAVTLAGAEYDVVMPEVAAAGAPAACFSGLGGVSANSARTKEPRIPLRKETTSGGS